MWNNHKDYNKNILMILKRTVVWANLQLTVWIKIWYVTLVIELQTTEEQLKGKMNLLFLQLLVKLRRKIHVAETLLPLGSKLPITLQQTNVQDPKLKKKIICIQTNRGFILFKRYRGMIASRWSNSPRAGPGTLPRTQRTKGCSLWGVPDSQAGRCVVQVAHSPWLQS